MVPKTNLDYVEMYAKKLKTDNRLFSQQKSLIESQMKISQSFFLNSFGENFKVKAREYLRKRGLI